GAGVWCRGSGLLRSVPNRVDRYVGSAVGFARKRHGTGLGGKEGMVLAHPDIDARMPLGAALTDDDVARNHGFAAELLDAEALGFGIATVTRGTASFLVCHGFSPSVPELFSLSLGFLVDLGA